MALRLYYTYLVLIYVLVGQPFLLLSHLQPKAFKKVTKGQIISKGLLVSSNSPNKQTNEFVFYYYDEFVRSFFGRI